MAPPRAVWVTMVTISAFILSSSHAATTAPPPAFDSGMTSQSTDGDIMSSASTKQDGVQTSTSSSKPDFSTTPAQTTTAPVVATIPIIHDEILPSVTFPATPRTEIIRAENRYVVMQCKADGKPTPRYEWFRDGIEILTSDIFTKAFANGTLILRSFYSNENGYFQCKASNSLGTSLSDIVHILAEVKPKGSNDVDRIMKIPENEPHNMYCDNLSPTVPVMEKRWYYGTQNDQLIINSRIGVDTDGSLHFAYTTLVDSSVYTCGLVPDSGIASSITLFKRGELKVGTSSASTLKSTKPKKVFSKQEIKATIGKSVTLECFFASIPEATITWKNSSHHVVLIDNPRHIVDDFGRKLIITKVRQEDEGTFSCTGKNDVGVTEIVINVNVTSPPMVVPEKALSSRTVVDHTDITLNCKTTSAVGEYLDPPRWYRNGILLTQNNVPDPARYKFNSDLTELLIKDLDKQADTACFQCNSSNSEGYEFFDASIRVINSIIITKQPTDENVIDYGDTVDITIQAKGDACCKINMRWSFNGSNIIQPEKWLPFQKDPISEKLIFNSSLMSEDSLFSYMGIYTCRVSNQHQSVDIKFTIILEGSRTEPVTTQSGSIGMWWIGLLCGVLAILIAVIIVVVLYKSNYPRSTYKLEQQEIKHNLNPEEDLLNQSFHEI